MNSQFAIKDDKWLTNGSQMRSISESLTANINAINVPQSLSSSSTSTSSSTPSQSRSSLPTWCEDMSRMPSLYREVWRNVQLNHTSLLCDTNKVYAILMSSGVSQTVLAQIWSAVNLTIPGQLTRHELFLSLALIGLIQQNSANPLTDVHSVDAPPIPRLHFNPNPAYNSNSLYQHSQQQTSLKQNIYSECSQPSIKSEVKNNILTPVTNDLSINGKTKFTPNYYIDINEINGDNNADDDDFADFKSADMSETVVQHTLPNHSVAHDFPQKLSLCSNYFNDDLKSVNFSKASDYNDNSKTVHNSIASEQSVNSHKFEIKNTKCISLADALSQNLSAISIHDNNNRLESNSITTNINKQTNNSNDALCSPNVSILESLSESVSESAPTVDKYSVFRDITIDDQLAKGDDFGEFLSHATNFDAESVDSLQLANQDTDNDTIDNIKQQVMNCCRQLIYKSFNVLIVNHGEESVIEAMSSSDGKNFALNLLEVYRIAKRIWKTTKSYESFAKLMEEIESAWNGVNSVFSKASLEINYTEEVANAMQTSVCAICRTNNSSNEQSFLSFGGYEYHFGCANLWLNCINSSLPKPVSLASR